MTDQLGLRERKKLRTAEHIANTALALFLERGFADVSVADVADAAEVSKKTVFNYFPAKEDLVLFPIRDHKSEPARVVRTRQPGESPVAALRRHFLTGLEERDPITGLADYDEFLAFQGMVMSTPSLKLRLLEQWTDSEVVLAEALAEALGEPADAIVPSALASLIISVQRTLIVRNVERMLVGADPAAVHAQCAAEAERAFGLLEKSLA
ncbi:TetR/AcrR family transcriptional regulator [Streptomyces acidiscabies]|uniref:TetR family transcriptional regulator n=1 Tax=Streptomyces acidiscabies TaxID=42234 RepID=A0AAP6EDR3_9ACTN|nr:TetR family transcriptional regulator [Streptomyces acidiscabies]MBP5939970.1 TetR family transcriptional regulator [Streptomyces sp. LBUM 1476]MBZ3911160.1 TetR family transcriptional regulator [Streptomyces acidiscabies]MDX2959058.1 TetR family transcriptional regulator [Streptomyces acidiscabies]MDX3023906.1 TetR family transcriptional regulator [Streptomyces acidiscabies]MDX3788273.1 TetR family transcriptional regulator [Streptomyces acidiscabies]